MNICKHFLKPRSLKEGGGGWGWRDVIVELDLSNYGTKADLKNYYRV